MNPRRRRGLVLLFVAGLGAIVVFVAVASYVSSVTSGQPAMATVFRLAADVPAYEEVPVGALEEVELPENVRPPSAVDSSEQLVGRVAATGLAQGSLLQNDMLIEGTSLQGGQREIAILVDAETGVAGRITPQSVVDIYATFEDQDSRCAGLLVPSARIVNVGVSKTQANPEQGGDLVQQEVLPVTFALGPSEARKLVYAESFAQEVRLALAPQGERPRRQRTNCARPPGVR
jgi:pilus assembly protein CpaB